MIKNSAASTIKGVLYFLIVCLYASCSQRSQNATEEFRYPDEPDQLTPKELVRAYCGSCHLPPDPQNIPKSIWEERVLPEMASRLGYRYNNYNPFNQYSLEESVYVRQTGIYPLRPLVDSATWKKIHDYIIAQAPDSIPTQRDRNSRNSSLDQFIAEPLSLDENVSRITSINYDVDNAEFVIGTAYGEVIRWSQSGTTRSHQFSSPPISYVRKATREYFTEIGYMNPSEIPLGNIHLSTNKMDTIISKLHRPVYTEVVDLNEDGEDEILVCEFGHLTGELALIVKEGDRYQKRTLLGVPGTIKLEIMDMNNDGKKDILVLASQGNEGLYLLYQSDNLQFRPDQVIRLGSEYGTSWFDLVDYDQDGDQDVVIANGDNADYTIFLKPYHGLRLYLNDGDNNFEQAWFYPIYGATRVIAEDFDNDNDIDFAVMSFFPGDGDLAREGFVYLKNNQASAFDFSSHAFDLSVMGRWLIMEKGDYDGDGDQDLMLGSFLFSPRQIQTSIEGWKPDQLDIILLKNTLN